MADYAAVVLAGGAGRRLGGPGKPAVPVGGRPMLDRVLAAVADAQPRIVVGPPAGLPPGTTTTREQPPGGGPVAATAAGLARVPDGVPVVALLAADLPLLTADAVAALRTALSTGPSIADGALFVDAGGRRQLLCGVWRAGALRHALDALADARRGGGLGGAAMGALVERLTMVEVVWTRGGPPPWFDCDTDDDLRRARRWAEEDDR
jgi:molybdopterin-guanine dinucleotide biosynthesis protein A